MSRTSETGNQSRELRIVESGLIIEAVSVVYIALPVALLLAIAGVIAFIWATKSGQMDDLETPGQRVLFDDDPVSNPDEPAEGNQPPSP
jgi:cbb3-type cytochrome oxidase maturation protein